jgi:hypothetical protein
MALWSRHRRRSLAPRRPALFPEQWLLLAVTLLFLVGSVGAVVLVVVGP